MATSAPEWQRTGKNIPRAVWLRQYLPRYQPTGAALWGITGLTAAIFLVQPFDYIDKTFIHPPAPEEVEDEVPKAAKE